MNSMDSIALTKKIKGEFRIDLLNKAGEIEKTIINHNDVAGWVNTYIMNSAFNTILKRGSAGTPNQIMFSNIFGRLNFMHDPDLLVTADNAIFPKDVQLYNVNPAVDADQIFDTIENGVRKTGVIYEVGLTQMNDVPINGVYWEDLGGTSTDSNISTGSVLEPIINTLAAVPSTQLNNFPSYRYDYHVNPAIETVNISTVWVYGQFALMQYTTIDGNCIRFRVINVKDRTTVHDPLLNNVDKMGITSIIQLSKAPHMFIAFGGIAATPNKINTNYLINLKDGTVKEFTCNTIALPTSPSFTVANAVPDSDGNLYLLDAFTAATTNIRLRKWNIGDPVANVISIQIDYSKIIANFPTLIKTAISTTPFTSINDFSIQMINGEITIGVNSYAIFSGQTNPNLRPVYNLDCEMLYSHTPIRGASNDYWCAYPGIRLMGSRSSVVVNATTTTFRLWGGAVPFMNKTAVGHFNMVEKKATQRLRLTYSFIMDCPDLMGSLIAPYGE